MVRSDGGRRLNMEGFQVLGAESQVVLPLGLVLEGERQLADGTACVGPAVAGVAAR